eukprot:2537937-Rhodomonas_salina.2
METLYGGWTPITQTPCWYQRGQEAPLRWGRAASNYWCSRTRGECRRPSLAGHATLDRDSALFLTHTPHLLLRLRSTPGIIA